MSADDTGRPLDVPTFEALRLDGTGSARPAAPAQVSAGAPGPGPLWVNLRRDDRAGESWLKEEAGLEPLATDALLAEETRPRWLALGDGAIVILRGVNLNPGADPEDMVSVRLWVEPERVISVHIRPVAAIGDVRSQLIDGRGPKHAGEIVVALAERLVARMAPVVEQLEDEAGELEHTLLDGVADAQLTTRLADLRRIAIRLRRYLAPKRDLLDQLTRTDTGWLDQFDRKRLAETADRVTRYVELLDAVREHAAVTQDELQNRTVQESARTTYLLTVVAALFLPLGFVTGLLGINVGGMPGVDSAWAFGLVCLLLIGLGALEIWLLRRLRWL
jgi:zinc transporter